MSACTRLLPLQNTAIRRRGLLSLLRNGTYKLHKYIFITINCISHISVAGDAFCFSSFTETVLGSSWHVAFVSHSTGTFATSTKCFGMMMVTTHFRLWVAAGSTSFLLDVERRFTATTTYGVALRVSFTETSGTFGHVCCILI